MRGRVQTILHFISDIFGLLFQATKELRDVTQ